jgi:DNA-binding MurR/RpiR family transcriptional regulator
LTDSDQSPLVGLCDQTIMLPATHPVLNSSTVASFAFFEAIAAVLTARYQSTSQATEMTRLIFPYLYTDDASPAPPPKEP